MAVLLLHTERKALQINLKSRSRLSTAFKVRPRVAQVGCLSPGAIHPSERVRFGRGWVAEQTVARGLVGHLERETKMPTNLSPFMRMIVRVSRWPHATSEQGEHYVQRVNFLQEQVWSKKAELVPTPTEEELADA